MRAWYMLITAVFTACAGDPVQDKAVAALGDETPGAPQGPLHRAGQPCTVCHQAGGLARAFAVAGTVTKSKDDPSAVEGVTIEVLDSGGARRNATTNAAGNFFVLADEWTPLWPIATRVVMPDGKDHRMQTPIFREGSCAKCHGAASGARSAGPVTP